MITTVTRIINWTILFSFIACFSYQAILWLMPYIRKEKPHLAEKKHRYAVLIAARNEAGVIRQLIDSIRAQTYPQELIEIYVVADNCTDDTVRIAVDAGAYVYERFNRARVGKGYALEYLLEQMKADHRVEYQDAFLVFDADNLLAPNYLEEMNRTFTDGYQVITSYRNSKNFGDNWISSGYGLWFLHEAQFLNRGRMRLGSSCMVSGTGFLFSRQVLERIGGWNFFLLTEDIEFSADCIVSGERIGYCERAVFYDEQPTRFAESWNQRIRWIKGYFQVYRKYGRKLLSGVGGRNGFACFDMLMSSLPAFVLTTGATAASLALTLIGLVTAQNFDYSVYSLGMFFVKSCAAMFVLGVYTVLTEWRQIRMPWYAKLLSMVTFPIYMMTYLPIAVAALRGRVDWKPVCHTCGVSLEQL